MTGVLEMFAEYDGSDRDDFQMAFWFERQYEAQREISRRSARLSYLRMRANPERHERKKAQMREWMAKYQREKRATDPAWLAKRRETNRLSMQRKRDRERAAKEAA